MEPSLFFIPPVRIGFSGHRFKVLQNCSRCLRRKASFSIRLVKYWNRLPTSVNLIRRGKNCLLESRNLMSFCTPFPPPITQSPFTLSPFYAIPTPNSLSFKIILMLKSFYFIPPYLYVVIEVLCCSTCCTL